jgi:hypothetical protein
MGKRQTSRTQPETEACRSVVEPHLIDPTDSGKKRRPRWHVSDENRCLVPVPSLALAIMARERSGNRLMNDSGHRQPTTSAAQVISASVHRNPIRRRPGGGTPPTRSPMPSVSAAGSGTPHPTQSSQDKNVARAHPPPADHVRPYATRSGLPPRSRLAQSRGAAGGARRPHGHEAHAATGACAHVLARRAVGRSSAAGAPAPHATSPRSGRSRPRSRPSRTRVAPLPCERDR